MHVKAWIPVFILFLLLASCNLPIGETPVTQVSATQPPEVELVSSAVDAVATSVELTSAAQLTEVAGSAVPATVTFTPEPAATFTFTPVPTQCSPLVTTSVVANVRSGPSTAYDIVGSLSLGQTATIAGRNDANNWWYIDYPAGSGSHAWIAGSVVTTSCLPQVVQVVAAPPLPTSVPDTSSSSDDEDEETASGSPDLVAFAMQYAPSGKTVSVQVTVRNRGDVVAGGFTVKWFANQDQGGCDWQVQGLGVGKSKNLECQYTYPWAANNYWSTLDVDTGGQVAEANENNNKEYFEVNLK